MYYSKYLNTLAAHALVKHCALYTLALMKQAHTTSAHKDDTVLLLYSIICIPLVSLHQRLDRQEYTYACDSC
jgi:hypothetical protein